MIDWVKLKILREVYIIKSLEYLADNQANWTSFWNLPVPEKWDLIICKFLINRGLSGGCNCGCRGDLCITDEGLILINRVRTHEYIGY